MENSTGQEKIETNIEEKSENLEEKEDKKVHPQAWLREKYSKEFKKPKNPIDLLEIPFYQMYNKPLETPEDIERYRQERIKNFPTKKNIEKKEKEKEEREKKGLLEMSKQIDKKKRKKSENLLNSLLEKDIKKENSCILQCLRYIVQNKFFTNEHSQRVAKKLKEIE